MDNELQEEWKEYNNYQVSNYGKVINKHGKLLTLKADIHGYIGTSITDYDKSRICGLHRIIATVFLPNPNNLPEVNHIDGVKANNRVDNLEWCTHDYNMNHEALILNNHGGTNNYMNKLTDKQVIEIHSLCKEGRITYKEIAIMYKMSPSVISSIAQAIRWRHLGLEPIVIKQGSHGKGRHWTETKI